jgi:hypothetical protein
VDICFKWKLGVEDSTKIRIAATEEGTVTTVDSALYTAIRTTLGLLVDGEYDTLAAMTSGKRLSGAEIRDAVRSYGRTLVQPPGDGLPDDLELVDVHGDGPRRVAATMSLYTAEEGRSDLSLELLLTAVAARLWTVQIDNIHVL